MKLYTIEQVKDSYLQGWYDGSIGMAYTDRREDAIDILMPIELPSDDEIARVGLEFSVGYNVEYWNGFKHCGDWMKEQILNQNK